MNCTETSHVKISARNKITLPVKNAMILWDTAYSVIYYVAGNKRPVWIRAYCKIRNLEDTSREISVNLNFLLFLCDSKFLILKYFFRIIFRRGIFLNLKVGGSRFSLHLSVFLRKNVKPQPSISCLLWPVQDRGVISTNKTRTEEKRSSTIANRLFVTL